MRFIDIDIENFMMAKKVKLQLAKRGLVGVVGRNLDSSAFDSNASGKSTCLVEALIWCIWGVTLRGAKADGILPEHGDSRNCCVKLVLEDEDTGILWEIHRYRKHKKHKNELFLYAGGDDRRGSSIASTQEKIDVLLGSDLQTFINSVVFGQGMTKKLKRYSELSDTEQKEVLELVLEIAYLAEAGERAKTAYARAQTELEDLEFRFTADIASLQEMTKRLERYRELENSFQQDKDKALRRLRKSYVEASVKEEAAWDKLPDSDLIKAALEDLTRQSEGLASELKEIEDQKKELRIKVRPILEKSAEERGRLRGKVAHYRSKQEALLKSPVEICDKCGQDVDVEKLEVRRLEYSAKEDEYKKAVKNLNKAIHDTETKYDDQLGVFSAEIQRIRKLEQEVALEIRGLHKDLNQAKYIQNDILGAQKDVETAKKNLEREQAREPVLDKASEDLEKSIFDTRTGLVKRRAVIWQKRRELEEIKFWVKAYGPQGIRALVLRSVSPFLNEKAAVYTEILTDGEISVDFKTEKTLKSGEKRNKCSVEPLNRYGSSTYTNNSGGERRRIDVAVALAIGDLVASRAKKKFNILILDEIFSEVDSAGTQAVMRLLNVLGQTKESIFVISHLTDLMNQLDDEMVIERRNGVCRLVV